MKKKPIMNFQALENIRRRENFLKNLKRTNVSFDCLQCITFIKENSL